MEAESGRDLERFFDRWVLDTALPRVRVTTVTKAETLEVAYEQLGETFDVPVTVTLQYADGTSEDVVVPMTDAAGTQVVPLRGALRNVGDQSRRRRARHLRAALRRLSIRRRASAPPQSARGGSEEPLYGGVNR